MKVYELLDELKDWLKERSTKQISTLNFNPYKQVLDKIEDLEYHYE